MTITINKPQDISHEDNMIYQVQCYNCPRISEENGDFLPGHMEIAGIHEHVNYEGALELAKNHESEEGEDHQIVIDGMDAEFFRRLL